jgi:DNA (cytosine-5)-methyltransferase 1
MVAIKLNVRGRGKSTPIKNLTITAVQTALQEAISKEQKKIDKLKDGATQTPKVVYDSSKWNIVSLFSGCGGLDLGLLPAGLCCSIGSTVAMSLYQQDRESFIRRMKDEGIFKIIYSVDNFNEAVQTYRQNAFSPETVHDTRDITTISKFPDCDMVVGGFPCPGFSSAGPRLLDDKRNFLYLHFIRVLMQTKAKIFVAENVKGLMNMRKGLVFEQMKQDFAAAGYKIYSKLLNATDYGVPQIRERVFIVGVREDLSFVYKFPSPTHGSGRLPIVTLRDAIKDLEHDSGEYATGSFSSMYMSRNRKKTWDEPSFTIQASGRQAPLHPSGAAMKKISKDVWILPGNDTSHRRLSIKEVARIQTFPDWFTFASGNSGSDNSRLEKIYKQIGNAVPVLLAKAVMFPIAEYARQCLSVGSVDLIPNITMTQSISTCIDVNPDTVTTLIEDHGQSN